MAYGSTDEIAKLRAERDALKAEVERQHKLHLAERSLADTVIADTKAERDRLAEALHRIADYAPGWGDEAEYIASIARAALAGQPAAAQETNLPRLVATSRDHADPARTIKLHFAEAIDDDAQRHIINYGCRSSAAPEHSASLENGQLLKAAKIAEEAMTVTLVHQGHAENCANRTIGSYQRCNCWRSRLAPATAQLESAIAAAEQAGPSPVDELLDALEDILAWASGKMDYETSFGMLENIAETAGPLLAKYGRADKQGGADG